MRYNEDDDESAHAHVPSIVKALLDHGVVGQHLEQLHGPLLLPSLSESRLHVSNNESHSQTDDRPLLIVAPRQPT